MKKVENKIMLITYPNSMGNNISELSDILEKHFEGVFGGIHILPFFPSSGDRGFAVINYDMVDPAYGTWEDIDQLGSRYYLMVDFMLNHVSIRCEEFKDYMRKGDTNLLGVLMDPTKSTTISNYYESDQFKKMLEYAKVWKKNNLFAADPLNNNETPANFVMRAVTNHWHWALCTTAVRQ